MAKDNLTVFQRLTKVFGQGGPSKSKYALDQQFKQEFEKQLLNTNSKEQAEKDKLQAQQSMYLNDNYFKVDNELYQQAVYYETTRMASYADFEAMEFTPEISAALDIFMEEATTTDEKGKVLAIYSESQRVKQALQELFYDILDIETNLAPWTRNTCKYGDNFIQLRIDPKKGIIGCQQLPNILIERREPGVETQSPYAKNNSSSKNIKFFYKNKDIEFNSWEMAHFRLLGDDRKLPYGTSILEKARRIWKQLILSEDAMLVYRVTRAPERRVFKIFVGNIEDEAIEPYIQKIANKFKRTQVVDPTTGQIDLRMNQLAVDQDYFIPVRDTAAPSPIETLPGACIALNTKIPLLDGRVLELQEIIKEWDEGKRDMWVYSCDPKTGSLSPGIVTWAGETRKNAEVIKITLDNGKELITTPDHKWVHRTKGFVDAQDLVVGDSLMPFYSDTKKIRSNTNKYERVWDSDKQNWVFTHRMVTGSLSDKNVIKEFIYDAIYDDCEKHTRHHKDFNRFNNTPTNIVFMNSVDHFKYHQTVIKETIWADPELNKEKITKGINRFISNLTPSAKEERGEISRNNSITSRDKSNKTFSLNPKRDKIIKLRGESISKSKSTKEVIEKQSFIAKNNWKSMNYRDKVFNKKQTITFTDNLYSMFFEMFKLCGRADLTLKKLNSSEDFMNEFYYDNKDIRSSLTNLSVFTMNHLDKMLKQRGFKNYRDWCKVTAKELDYKNVRSWRYHINKDKVINYNHKITHIEWLSDTMDTGTITVDGNELYHNYHTFATESGVFIKNSNLDQIADIEYIQRKLFTALRVPKPFLGFEETSGEGKNLAMMDVRFARTINRVQQAMIQELNKIAIIHLYILGFEDDLENFTLGLSNPSTQADILKVEQWKEKVTLYRDLVADAGNGFGASSMTWAKKNILGFSDDEIILDLEQQRIEKAAANEIQNTGTAIPSTGIFDKVDKLYGGIKGADTAAAADTGGEAEGGLETGGAAGGGFGGGETDLGGGETELGGEETGFGGGETGGEAPPAEGGEPLAERTKIITEDVLNGTVFKKKTSVEDRILKASNKVLNEDIKSMIEGIDKLLD